MGRVDCVDFDAQEWHGMACLGLPCIAFPCRWLPALRLVILSLEFIQYIQHIQRISLSSLLLSLVQTILALQYTHLQVQGPSIHPTDTDDAVMRNRSEILYCTVLYCTVLYCAKQDDCLPHGAGQKGKE